MNIEKYRTKNETLFIEPFKPIRSDLLVPLPQKFRNGPVVVIGEEERITNDDVSFVATELLPKYLEEHKLPVDFPFFSNYSHGSHETKDKPDVNELLALTQRMCSSQLGEGRDFAKPYISLRTTFTDEDKYTSCQDYNTAFAVLFIALANKFNPTILQSIAFVKTDRFQTLDITESTNSIGIGRDGKLMHSDPPHFYYSLFIGQKNGIRVSAIDPYWASWNKEVTPEDISVLDVTRYRDIELPLSIAHILAIPPSEYPHYFRNLFDTNTTRESRLHSALSVDVIIQGGVLLSKLGSKYFNLPWEIKMRYFIDEIMQLFSSQPSISEQLSEKRDELLESFFAMTSTPNSYEALLLYKLVRNMLYRNDTVKPSVLGNIQRYFNNILELPVEDFELVLDITSRPGTYLLSSLQYDPDIPVNSPDKKTRDALYEIKRTLYMIARRAGISDEPRIKSQKRLLNALSGKLQYIDEYIRYTDEET